MAGGSSPLGETQAITAEQNLVVSARTRARGLADTELGRPTNQTNWIWRAFLLTTKMRMLLLLGSAGNTKNPCF